MANANGNEVLKAILSSEPTLAAELRTPFDEAERYRPETVLTHLQLGRLARKALALQGLTSFISDDNDRRIVLDLRAERRDGENLAVLSEFHRSAMMQAAEIIAGSLVGELEALQR